MTDAPFKTGYLRSKDHTSLFFRHACVPDKKATVLLMHGFGEHSGRYFHVIDNLQREGFSVFCLDFRGHGHSEGKRGDVRSFSHYEEDFLSALEHVKNNFADDKKVFVLAHSMGALVSIRGLLRARADIHGIVMSSPLFSLKMSIPIWKRWASAAVASVVPRVQVGTGIKGRHLSSDREIVASYDGDPLVLKSLSIRAFRQILFGYEDAAKNLANVSFPLFMQVAGADPVVDPTAAERWFSRIKRDKLDVTMKIYPDFLHEIYNETNRQIAIDDFIGWYKARL